MTVLDLSSYDLPTLDPAGFKAAGVTGVICGVYDPVNPPTNMLAAGIACRDAGLDLLGWYGFCYFGSPYGVLRDTRWAINNALYTGCGRVWVDVETDGLANGFTDGISPTPAQRIAELHQCIDLILDAGLRPGIYTGRWFWVPQMANTTEFSHLPLWNSFYDGDPDPDGLPYGGWSTSAVEQYSSSYNICGRDRDVNYIYEGDEMNDDLLLAVYSGSEDVDEKGALLSRQVRLANARYRMVEAAEGRAQSVSEQAASAKANMAEHIAKHAAGVTGQVTEHTHQGGKVVRP
jgi:hypothetical protein